MAVDTADAGAPDRNPAVRIEVTRGGIWEAFHDVIAAEVDSGGRLVRAYGGPDTVTTLRSAAKPLQAVPLLTLPGSAALGLGDEEIAICCASHPGEPRHAALAASVLALSGFLPDNLVCGPPPHSVSPLKHGCSGNHAAILLIARLLDAPLDGYYLPDHPAQILIAETIQRLAVASEMPIATDGCGIPTFGLSLTEMARAFAALVRQRAVWERLPRSMAAHPDLIGSPDWIDVRLMQETAGRIIAKTGAEGLLCLANTETGRGMAIKTIGGATRALTPAAIHILREADWLTEPEIERLQDAHTTDSSHGCITFIVNNERNGAWLSM